MAQNEFTISGDHLFGVGCAVVLVVFHVVKHLICRVQKRRRTLSRCLTTLKGAPYLLRTRHGGSAPPISYTGTKKAPFFGASPAPFKLLSTANIRRDFLFSKFLAHFFLIFFLYLYKRRTRSPRLCGGCSWVAAPVAACLFGAVLVSCAGLHRVQLLPSRAERLTRHRCAGIGSGEGVTMCSPSQRRGHVQGLGHLQGRPHLQG